jgi:hypothetical protein
LKRTLILGNLVLALVIGALAYGVWQRNRDAITYERQVLSRKPVAKPEVVPLPPPVAAATPQTYAAETVQHFLFTPDRNPNVIVKPSAPPPPPVMPPLPAAYGEMFFGDPIILLSTKAGTQHGYRAGEMVGEFKLVDFDEDKVTFEWRDKNVERSLAELMKVQPPAAKAAETVAPGVSHPPADSQSAAGSQNPDAATQGQPGQQVSPTFRACLASDASPAGTVSSDGFTKKLVKTMFGNQCSWVK